MKDFFYKFLDEQEMFILITPLGMTSIGEDGTVSLIEGNHMWAAWNIGILNGYDGWHLNVRQIDPDFDLLSLDSYQVYPSEPKVIWF